MNLVKIWKLADKKPLFALQILTNIGIAGITILISNFARNAVDFGIEDGALYKVMLKFSVLTLLILLLSYSNVLFRSHFSIGLIEKLRNKAAASILSSKYEYFENESSSGIYNRMLNDMNKVADYMAGYTEPRN
jgi:ATP-binding cassette, subfamily B, bacterial